MENVVWVAVIDGDRTTAANAGVLSAAATPTPTATRATRRAADPVRSEVKVLMSRHGSEGHRGSGGSATARDDGPATGQPAVSSVVRLAGSSKAPAPDAVLSYRPEVYGATRCKVKNWLAVGGTPFAASMVSG
jgi:hypothetical protein